MTTVITPPPIVTTGLDPVRATTDTAHDAEPQVLGVPFAASTEAELLAAIEAAITKREPTVFVGLYAALFRALGQNQRYRRLMLRSQVYPDGQGVVRELRRRGRGRAQRVATTDVIHPLSDLAGERGWRIGLYGGADGVAERAAAALVDLHPEAKIVATWSGFGTPPSLGELRAAKLDILLVGLGAGKQEHYAHTVAAPAGVPAILTCGGLFDFLSGDARRAPIWMQSAGLEWAFRVMREPRRYFVRYLLGNTFFLTAARAERFVHARTRGTSVASSGYRGSR